VSAPTRPRAPEPSGYCAFSFGGAAGGEGMLVGMASPRGGAAPSVTRVLVFVNNQFEGHTPATVGRRRTMLSA